MPQEAHLRCCLQEPHGRSARAFVQRRLTKRSLEGEFSEVHILYSPGPVRSTGPGLGGLLRELRLLPIVESSLTLLG
jgi:hypothetical protein